MYLFGGPETVKLFASQDLVELTRSLSRRNFLLERYSEDGLLGY